MKAAVFHKIGDISVDNVDDPRIDAPDDIILKAHVHKYIDELFEIVRNGKVTLNDIITHRLPLSEATHAYDIFKKKKDDCVKVILKPGMDN